MPIKTVFLLFAGVAAEEYLPTGEYPFSRSFDLESLTPAASVTDPFTGLSVPSLPVDHALRHPVCASEESFFKKELSFKEKGHGNVAFRFKGEKASFLGLDSPFSHDANAQSMLMIEEEQARETEKKKLLLKAGWKNEERFLQVLQEAEQELERTEQQIQEMAKQAWENPSLANDASFVDMRKRLIKQQGLVQDKVMLFKDRILVEGTDTQAAVQEELQKVKFDTWYINMNKSVERKNCLERQLIEAGIESPNRFPAVEIRGMTKKGRMQLERQSRNPKKAEQFYLTQLRELGYGDCVEGGIDFDGTSTHGSQETNQWHIRNAVIANYCGHKRLLKEQEKNATASEFIVVMEDDVIVDRSWFKVVIEDFIQNFQLTHGNKWSMVQLDPFGYKSSEDFVGHFRGKPVWKPQFKAPCSQYWGFQAVIFRKSALPKINKYLSENPAMPIDWLQYKVDNSLAFSSLIARNPESLANDNWQVVGEKKVVLPSFCAKTVMKSTIARQKVTQDMFA